MRSSIRSILPMVTSTVRSTRWSICATRLRCQVDHRIWRQLTASWALRWQERMNGYHPYTKVDVRLRWTAPTYNIYVKADNITNHHYYDLGNVRQPGIWVIAGASVKLKF